MNYVYHSDILVLPQDVQDFAWSAPMRDLAAKVGLSDVGLKKLLKSKGVMAPPQGHWNRIHAGKPVPKCAKVPPRRPGESGRIHVDHRFANVLTAVEPIPSSGPFASAAVPVDLDQLYQRELAAIGRVTVPRKLERFHHGLAQIFKQEERRRVKAATSSWHRDAPKFNGPVDQRRFRILNATFMVLSKRGHGGKASERDGRIDATAIVGDMGVDIDIAIAGKHRSVREYGRDVPTRDLPVSTPLILAIDGQRDRPGETVWQDDAAGKLETRSGRSLPTSLLPAKRGSGVASRRPRTEWKNTGGGRSSGVARRSRGAMPSASSIYGQAASCYARPRTYVRSLHASAGLWSPAPSAWIRRGSRSGSAGRRPRPTGSTRSCRVR